MSVIQKTQSNTDLPVRHIRKNYGDARSLLGGRLSVKISTEETQGHFCLCAGLIGPNTAVPLHYHPDAEAFIVLDGSLDVFRLTNGKPESLTVQAGEMALIPCNAVHEFRNRSGGDVRVLTLCTAGLEAFSEEASIRVDASRSDKIEPPTPLEIERVLAIARKHGQMFTEKGGPNHAAL
ncbi:MAG TPA: cupin domain-containing protein [Candidatus Acidoferrum sp.]|nr:cupin domain-containing protein [Candidatus Acidoferrum sp.]